MSQSTNTQRTEIKRRKRAVSPKVVQALEHLASGRARTQSEAASMASISPEWLSKMLKRREIGVMIDEMCRKFLQTGKVRATARLVELLDSTSQRTSLEASKHVLGIGGISPPREGGVTINTGGGGVGYIVQLGNRDAEVYEGEISDVGGVLVGRRMTEAERLNGVKTTPGHGPLIDISPNAAEPADFEPARHPRGNGHE